MLHQHIWKSPETLGIEMYKASSFPCDRGSYRWRFPLQYGSATAYWALHQNRHRKAGCWFLWRFAACVGRCVRDKFCTPLKSSYESFSNSQVAFEEPPVFSSDMGMVHRSLTQNSVKQWGFAMIGPSESYFNIESWCCIWSEAPPIWIMGLLKIEAAWLQKFLDKSSRMLCTFESPVRFDVLILHHKLAGSWRRKLWWERPSYTKPAENVQPLACYSTGRNQLEGSQAGCPANIETLLWFCMIQNTFVIFSEYFISQDSEPSNCSHTTW